MKDTELIYYMRQFSNMFGMPVRLYRGAEKIFFYPAVNIGGDPADLCYEELMGISGEVGYFIYDDDFYYGVINHNGYKAVIGFVSEIKAPEEKLRKIGVLTGERDIEGFIHEVQSLSGVHLDTLLQAVILFNFTVNRTMHDISDIRIRQPEQKKLTGEIKSDEVLRANFYENNARTASIEIDIVRKIMNGDVEGLIDGATKIPAVSAGQLAPNLLRHQKNFFIKLETICARASLQAGLDPDEILTAEQQYINKCESLDDPERIKNLQYHMIVDYADRVRKFRRYNGKDSKLISDVTRYIRSHLSEFISTSDIAEYLGKSRVSVTNEFKRQTGVNLSEFIKVKKIDEARELLYSTDKSMTEISYFLGFSSQSHFGKVFKEITGTTPAEYRKSNKI